MRTANTRSIWKRLLQLTAVAGVFALAGSYMVQLPNAMAAGETVAVSITAEAGPGGDPEDVRKLIGAPQLFRVQWECGGPEGACLDGKIEVPVPLGQPGDIPLEVTSMSGITIGGSTYPGVIEGTAPNQRIVWNLPASVTTGAQGTVSFSLLASSKTTPDGTVVAPTATFTTSNTEPAVDSASMTYDATAGLEARKFKLTPSGDPWVNQQIRYRVLVGYPEQFSPDLTKTTFDRTLSGVCNANGVMALQDLVVVDQLEAGVEYVTSDNGGVYDPTSHTVTWNLGNTITQTGACTTAGWGVNGVTVTVRYPTPTFQAGQQVVNRATATAHAWDQPEVEYEADAQTGHGLRESSPGTGVINKRRYFSETDRDNFMTPRQGDLGNPVVTTSTEVFRFYAANNSGTPAVWTLTDMMPCVWTSPTDVNQTDCATPAFTNIRFAADGSLPELDIAYTTNLGNTGVCTIPGGVAHTDPRRFCGNAADSSVMIPGLDGSVEWITKFEIDTPMPGDTQGYVRLYATATEHVPADNTDAQYDTNIALTGAGSGGDPVLGQVVTRSDVHPQWVTVENCTADNTMVWPSGQTLTTNDRPTQSDRGGRCGYASVVVDQFRVQSDKMMWDPELSGSGTIGHVPTIEPGADVRIQIRAQRIDWPTTPQKLADARFIPIFEDILDASLELDEDSFRVTPAAVADTLGQPNVETESLADGRTRVLVTFPDAGEGLALRTMANLIFDARVATGNIAGSYQNVATVMGEGVGPEVTDTYLICENQDLVTANGDVTTDRRNAVGCAPKASYMIAPIPALSVSKGVEGSDDVEFIEAPGVGTTDVNGEASYQLHVTSPGSVPVNRVVVYDMLPRIGDTSIRPGTSTPRNSEFDVYLTGPVTGVPAGATALYSTSDNPCRGELAGAGGGTRSSAPAGCDDDWAAAGAISDWSTVTGIRVDFSTVAFAPGESITLEFPVVGDATAAAADVEGVAWNNVAVAAYEQSSGVALLPTEAASVGLRMLPKLVWTKTDGTSGALLDGSEWLLTPVEDGEPVERDGWPLEITDCVESAATDCDGADLNPAAGEFTLAGIPWGEYQLTETAAPAGFVALTDPIDVVISGETIDLDTGALDIGVIENEREPILVCHPDLTYAINSDGLIVEVAADGSRSPFGGAEGLAAAQSFRNNWSAPPNWQQANGLAMNEDAVYANVLAGGLLTRNVQIIKYDRLTGAPEALGSLKTGLSVAVIGGAMDPVTGRYLIGGFPRLTSGTNVFFALYEYDDETDTLRELGTVALGHSSFVNNSNNGDFAFDASGNLFIVTNNATNADNGTGRLAITTVTASDLSAARASDTPIEMPFTRSTPRAWPQSIGQYGAVNGISFGSDGSMYLGSTQRLWRVDPSTATVLETVTTNIFGTMPGTATSIDLASCATPPTLVLRKDVVERADSNDQFDLSIRVGNSTVAGATTAGDATGIQQQQVGPIPVLAGETFTIRELGNAADLNDYNSSYVCTAGGEVISSGDGTTGEVQIPSGAGSGAAVECTFTNNPIAETTFGLEKYGEDELGDEVLMEGSAWAVFADDGGEPGDEVTGVVTPVTGEPGRFTLTLSPGVYWLLETAAPDGFQLLAEPVQFSVTAEQTIVIDGATVDTRPVALVGDGSAESPFTIQVYDVPAFDLPVAGGMGEWPFQLAGALLLLMALVAAGVLAARSRRVRPMHALR